MCIEGLQSLELTHRNFTAFEAGFNVKSGFTMNRRLTCTPVNLEPTLKKSIRGKHYITVQDTRHDSNKYYNMELETENGPNMYINECSGSIMRILKGRTRHDSNRYYNMELETENGPNNYSNESSGLKMKILKGRNDISILPTSSSDTVFKTRENLFPKLNPSFERKDGLPFLIIWRGGTVNYREPVDDPFFSAHQELLRAHLPTYSSDQEATGLGCVEQLQRCFPEIGKCSSWGRQIQNEEFLLIAEAIMMDINPKRTPDYDYGMIQKCLGDFMSQFFSLYRYLNFRAKFSKIEIPLTTRHKDLKKIEHGDEEWVFLIEEWFQKSYLQGIFWVRNGARWHLVESISRITPKQKEKISFCDRIIFRDSGYTNINFLGLCLASMFLCLFCLSGHLIKTVSSKLAKIKIFTARSLDLLRQAGAGWWLLVLATREKVNAVLARNLARRREGEESACFRSSSQWGVAVINEQNSRWTRSTRPSPSSEPDPYGLDDLRPNVSLPD